MLRSTFLATLAASTAVPGSGVSPAPSSAPPDVAGAPSCKKNPFLPYDKHLEFRDSALDGPDFDLKHYRGYGVWINIFATWCGPCRAEQARVVSTAAAYREKGIRTIGLFAREQDDAVRAYRKKYAIPYPVVRDENGALTANLQGSGGRTVFPAHLFIDGSGYLYCYETGGIDQDALENILGHLVTTTASPLPDDPEMVPGHPHSSV